MRAVNLLVREQQQRRSPNKVVLAGAASSGAVLMLLGALYVNSHGTVQRKQASLDELKAELAALPPKKETSVAPSGNAKLVSEKAGRLSALSSALSTRVRWDRIVRELSIVLPDDVWLTSVDATSPVMATEGAPSVATTVPGTPPTAPPTEAAATTFNIVGHTYNHEGVARLLIRLQLIPDLTNVQLSSSSAEPSAEGAAQSVQFTITATVKAAGAGS